MRNPLEVLMRGQPLPESDGKKEAERYFSGEWSLPEAPSSPASLPPWLQNAYAEAAIVEGIFHPENTVSLPEVWKELHPFGEDTPALGELLSNRNCAMACFPTCSGEQSALWHLFVFNNRFIAEHDHRRFLSDGTMFGLESAVFLSTGFQPPVSKLRGCSWQLAARIALELEEPSRPELARRWLITGEVRDNKVVGVTVGAKQSLFDETDRNILLPRDNQSELSVTSRIYPVETVEQALRLIDRKGIEGIDVELPPLVRDLHILIGGAIPPVVTVILLLSPQRVFLWSSSETRGNAEIISSALATLFPEMIRNVCLMDSHDLQKAYNQISIRLKQEECRSADTLVCNTGGNRLMGIAALLAANSHNLTVVYRDLNAAPDVLTALKLGDVNRYQSGDIPINRCRIRNRINWYWLYSPSRETIDTPDELVEKIVLAEE